MMTIETLAVAAPILVAVAAGLFGLATNYFDDKATAKRQKQKPTSVVRETSSSGVFLSDLSEAEREQLQLHVETLEAFAETVRNASAIVEQSTRGVNMTAAAQRSLENEKR
jgi:hypothetical protein